ncbi:meiotic coiled-coil protein 2 [Nannizzia gypsea CBS 118893]|uniref:Meiotic coiled-coil protein 2 n=1 Tax=Arthroderma gypseum (strain ATCC MYA-4604 / CBS 118893) TaxID=535722 RepID=E4UV43_ARTGP|nr:meiotic coiled-coil protein 2 [Nannizzia gypsea CBS 118893]EFR01160.1 meiotic coiled-coil protein 2 [Nannizzia gypsea CBS 118893]
MSYKGMDSSNASQKPSTQFKAHIDPAGNIASHGRLGSGTMNLGTVTTGTNPLVSSKLGNIQNAPPAGDDKKMKADQPGSSVPQSVMEQILAKLSPKDNNSGGPAGSSVTKSMDAQPRLARQPSGENATSLVNHTELPPAVEGPIPLTTSSQPNLNGWQNTVNTGKGMDTQEMFRLQQELEAANSRIALQEQELAQTRVIKQTLDQAMGPPSEVDFGGREITEQTISSLQNAFNASTRQFNQHQEQWSLQDDAHSDISDALSAGGYNRARGLWNAQPQPPVNNFGNVDKIGRDIMFHDSNMSTDSTRSWGTRISQPEYTPQAGFPVNQRMVPGHASPPYGFDNRYSAEPAPQIQGPTGRRATQVNRGSSCFPPQTSPWGTFPPSLTPIPRPASQQHAANFQPQNTYPAVNTYQPRPIGTPLSPMAAEFTAYPATPASWASSATTGAASTYVSPLEPLNYRRLLDKSVSCDWKYIVDKIVCNNDQQASIFLQQKLKVGTSEQKYEIIEAIANQAYPLMINRFGNFLVQRCFEHGTPEQVISIANAIRGNTLSLSMDPFGCHVIQKAFDCVPEEHKAVMVHELLRRIPETVIHRYACHVWQKLFELRWSGEPPQIMAKVNEALRGMWHEVALGETGSLVVQNIFENCVEDEKRQAIEEVLAKIDLLAHGQFGNWCIQHICEHGAPPDKSRAIEHILAWVTDYSMDQFASKVVEKCLKIGGTEFLDRYLARVCTGRPDRPRMPLIDIAGDQYGNYLIQWILLNAGNQHRELVAGHIRKHMVSLRGSKFGSRVAMLCCNPNHVTRPGPGAGIQISRFNAPSEDRGPSTMNGTRFNRNSQWSSNYPPFR